MNGYLESPVVDTELPGEPPPRFVTDSIVIPTPEAHSALAYSVIELEGRRVYQAVFNGHLQ